MSNEKHYAFSLNNDSQTNILYQKLCQQSIDMYGVDSYYIPLEIYSASDLSLVFREVKSKVYSRVYKMRMLLSDYLLMGGAGDMYSKFGLTISDEVTLYITRQEFIDRLTRADIPGITNRNQTPSLIAKDTNLIRPKISDLIWLPHFNSLFNISYVENQENKILGHNAFWKLIMKKHDIDISETMSIYDSGGQTGGATGSQSEADIVNRLQSGEGVKRDFIININQTGFTTSTPGVLNPSIEKQAHDTIKDPKASDSIFDNF